MAYAKANPGKLAYGSTGNLTSPHLTTEQVAQKAGIKLLHVPYKGSADLMQAVLGGHLMAASDSTGFAPQVEAGKLRVLNTWGDKRLEKFPDAPTLKELGYDMVVTSPYGLSGPKGMDPGVVKALHDACKEALFDPANAAVRAQFDMPLEYHGTEDYRAFVARLNARAATGKKLTDLEETILRGQSAQQNGFEWWPVWAVAVVGGSPTYTVLLDMLTLWHRLLAT